MFFQDRANLNRGIASEQEFSSLFPGQIERQLLSKIKARFHTVVGWGYAAMPFG
jgi:hypothetical protein